MLALSLQCIFAVASLSSRAWAALQVSQYPEPESDTKYDTTTDQDLYVIHAMVYEVGILTNATSNDTGDTTDRGEQVALTFYHNNGSGIDFSKIPEPLYTNVTSHALTGVSAVPANVSPLENSMQDNGTAFPESFKEMVKRFERNVESSESDDIKLWPSSEDSNSSSEETHITSYPEMLWNAETYLKNPKLMKRETGTIYLNNTSYQPTNGSVMIPSEAALQSIAIPPLLSLNGNLSAIPIPIPNTSVISYSTLSTHTRALNETI